LALALATNPEEFAAARAKLASNRTIMPLFDSGKFTRHIEMAYDLAYDRFLHGRPAADIVVPA
jgi:predicted O-linked N-acetylglucosamine transferase (SPINDLY family)